MKLLFRFCLLPLALFLANCVASTNQDTSVPTQTQIGVEASTTPDKLNDAMIQYEISGGIAGVSDSWTVYGDGRFSPTDGSLLSIDTLKLASLLKDLELDGFFDLKIRIDPFSSCADCFMHKLTISYEGQTNEISWHDGDLNLPVVVHDISEMMTSFLVLDPPIQE